MSARCEGCWWFTLNNQMEVPPKPATHARWLGINWRRDRRDVILERCARSQAIKWNETGLCRLLPLSVEKHMGSACSHHTPKETPNADA